MGLEHDAHAWPSVSTILGLRQRWRSTKVLHGDVTLSIQGLLAFRSAFRAQMSVKSVHSREVLVTSFTCKRPIIRMELLMPLAVVLSCKALATSRPLALEWFLLIVRSHMTFQVEAPGECAPTPWYRAHEVGFLLPPYPTGICCPASGDIGLGHNCNGIHLLRHRRSQVMRVMLQHGRLSSLHPNIRQLVRIISRTRRRTGIRTWSC